jgi:hypothetical protein
MTYLARTGFRRCGTSSPQLSSGPLGGFGLSYGTNPMKRIEILPVQAYLEQSRSFLAADINGIPKDVSEDSHLPLTFVFAFLSQSYLFSYMAVQTFAAEQLWTIWNADDQLLQQKYPKATNFEHLLNSDLKDIKEQLKAMAEILDIPPIHVNDPILWNNLLQVLKVTRDFLTHPSLDPDKVDSVIGHVMTKRDWRFASGVASKVILHFIQMTGSPVPEWIHENTLFTIPLINVLAK